MKKQVRELILKVNEFLKIKHTKSTSHGLLKIIRRGWPLIEDELKAYDDLRQSLIVYTHNPRNGKRVVVHHNAAEYAVNQIIEMNKKVDGYQKRQTFLLNELSKVLGQKEFDLVKKQVEEIKGEYKILKEPPRNWKQFGVHVKPVEHNQL